MEAKHPAIEDSLIRCTKSAVSNFNGILVYSEQQELMSDTLLCFYKLITFTLCTHTLLGV